MILSVHQVSSSTVLQKDVYITPLLNLQAFQTNQPTFRKAMATVVLEVVDVNNHQPVMSETFYNGSVQENLARGTLVYRVQAYDEDRVGILKTGEHMCFFYVSHIIIINYLRSQKTGIYCRTYFHGMILAFGQKLKPPVVLHVTVNLSTYFFSTVVF